MTDAETRKRYIELKVRADAAYKAAEPQRQALKEAKKPYDALLDEIEKLLDGAEVQTCSGCMGPIFDDDPRSRTSDDADLCVQCAPTYEDIRNNPEWFVNADGDPMSGDEANALCDAHIAAGGSLSDTTAH